MAYRIAQKRLIGGFLLGVDGGLWDAAHVG
jgi:hypothetical protein